MPNEFKPPLPLQEPTVNRCTEIFFPLGFPVCVVTNRVEVLEMARNSWGNFPSMSGTRPLVIELEFIAKDLPGVLEEPCTRIDKPLLTVTFDHHGVVVADLERGIARGILSEALLKMELHLRYYVLEAIALSMISTLRAVALHGASIAWNGAGVLLCGETGAGKTTLAYACARSGWTYVSDDASYLMLEEEGSRVVGNCHQIRFRETSSELFTELRGRERTLRAAGKPSIEVGTKELPTIRQSASADIQSIFFLNRSGQSDPGLYAITRERVERYITNFLLMPAPCGSPTHAALKRLLGVPMFELRYTELDWCVRFLTKTIEDICKWVPT